MLWVTGRKHYQLELESLGECDVEGQLIREPDNPFDPNAVRIEALGRKIGYVPRDDAERLASRMDADDTPVVPCRVTVIPPGPRRAMWAAKFDHIVA